MWHWWPKPLGSKNASNEHTLVLRLCTRSKNEVKTKPMPSRHLKALKLRNDDLLLLQRFQFRKGHYSHLASFEVSFRLSCGAFLMNCIKKPFKKFCFSFSLLIRRLGLNVDFLRTRTWKRIPPKWTLWLGFGSNFAQISRPTNSMTIWHQIYSIFSDAVYLVAKWNFRRSSNLFKYLETKSVIL